MNHVRDWFVNGYVPTLPTWRIITFQTKTRHGRRFERGTYVPSPFMDGRPRFAKERRRQRKAEQKAEQQREHARREARGADATSHPNEFDIRLGIDSPDWHVLWAEAEYSEYYNGTGYREALRAMYQRQLLGRYQREGVPHE